MSFWQRQRTLGYGCAPGCAVVDSSVAPSLIQTIRSNSDATFGFHLGFARRRGRTRLSKAGIDEALKIAVHCCWRAP